MKKINIPVILGALALFTLGSCYEDEGDVTTLEENVTAIPVEATVSVNRDFTGDGDLIGLDVSISRAIDSTATLGVEVRIDDARGVNTFVELPAGQTSIFVQAVVPPGNAFAAEGITPIENMADAKVIGLVSNVPGEQYAISSNEVELDLYDRLPSVNRDAATILFDWTNPLANDLDMQLFYDDNGAFVNIANGFSSTRYEELSIGSDPVDFPDGDYLVFLSAFTANDTPIDYNVFYRTENGSNIVFDGLSTFTADEIAGGRIDAIITKTTDADGEVSFIVTLQ